MDRISPERRSRNMAQIRAKDTQPELAVRRLLHSWGYRYRLHVGALPGKPDLVLPRHGCVVFVHGCFWHQHPKCRRAFMPTSRRDFWSAKLKANMQRDSRAASELIKLGWRVLTIWECETHKPDLLAETVAGFLPPQRAA